MKKGYLIVSANPKADIKSLSLKAEIAADTAGIESAYLNAQDVVYLTNTYKKALRKAAIRALRENGYRHVVGLYLSPDTHPTEQITELEKLLSAPPCYEEGFDELYLVNQNHQLIRYD